MSEAALITIAVAVVGILKGKDIWDFLKHWRESKTKEKDKLIEMYEKELTKCQKRNQQLERKKGKLEKMIK